MRAKIIKDKQLQIHACSDHTGSLDTGGSAKYLAKYVQPTKNLGMKVIKGCLRPYRLATYYRLIFYVKYSSHKCLVFTVKSQKICSLS